MLAIIAFFNTLSLVLCALKLLDAGICWPLVTAPFVLGNLWLLQDIIRWRIKRRKSRFLKGNKKCRDMY